MNKIALALVVALCAAGCAGIPLDDGAGSVRLTENQAMANGCSFIRQETISVTNLEAYGPELLMQGIVNKMKNIAHSSGANIVITSGPREHGSGSGAMMMTGDLYRC